MCITLRMKDDMELRKKNRRLLVFYVLAVLVATGALSFGYQTFRGLGVTGLREPVVWGLYVVNFTFFLGLGAGILMILALISAKEEISNKFKFLLSATAFISLSVAGIFITVDLGRIDRFYYLIIYPHPQSPLFWDFVMLNILIFTSFVFCFVLLRRIFLNMDLPEKSIFAKRLIYRAVTFRKDIKMEKLLSRKASYIILLFVAVAYLVTPELFVSLKAHPEWNTPLLSLIFLISSILCGFSAAILSEQFYNIFFNAKNSYFSSVKLKKIFLCLLTLDIGAIAAKYAIDKSNPLIERIYTLFPFSFLIFLILGNVAPILLILAYRRKESALTYSVVPLLIMSGILLKRADTIIPAYFKRWLQFASEAVYVPAMPEILISLSLYSMGVLAVIGIFYLLRQLTGADKEL